MKSLGSSGDKHSIGYNEGVPTSKVSSTKCVKSFDQDLKLKSTSMP